MYVHERLSFITIHIARPHICQIEKKSAMENFFYQATQKMEPICFLLLNDRLLKLLVFFRNTRIGLTNGVLVFRKSYPILQNSRRMIKIIQYLEITVISNFFCNQDYDLCLQISMHKISFQLQIVIKQLSNRLQLVFYSNIFQNL